MRNDRLGTSQVMTDRLSGVRNGCGCSIVGRGADSVRVVVGTRRMLHMTRVVVRRSGRMNCTADIENKKLNPGYTAAPTNPAAQVHLGNSHAPPRLGSWASLPLLPFRLRPRREPRLECRLSQAGRSPSSPLGAPAVGQHALTLKRDHFGSQRRRQYPQRGTEQPPEPPGRVGPGGPGAGPLSAQRRARTPPNACYPPSPIDARR